MLVEDLKMIKDISKIDRVGKYGGARVYIPSNVVNDSQFPIKLGSEVEVRIDTKLKALIISLKTDDARTS